MFKIIKYKKNNEDTGNSLITVKINLNVLSQATCPQQFEGSPGTRTCDVKSTTCIECWEEFLNWLEAQEDA